MYKEEKNPPFKPYERKEKMGNPKDTEGKNVCEKCGGWFKPTGAKDFFCPNCNKSFKEWLALEEYAAKKSKRDPEKITDYVDDMSKGSRDMRKDLKDWPGNLKSLGDGIGVFKLLGRHGKTAAPVAH